MKGKNSIFKYSCLYLIYKNSRQEALIEQNGSLETFNWQNSKLFTATFLQINKIIHKAYLYHIYLLWYYYYSYCLRSQRIYGNPEISSLVNRAKNRTTKKAKVTGSFKKFTNRISFVWGHGRLWQYCANFNLCHANRKRKNYVHNTQSKLFNDPINYRVRITKKQIYDQTRNFFIFEGIKISRISFSKSNACSTTQINILFFSSTNRTWLKI